MIQFNSLDRPEDRPYNLKWLIGGNVLPGLAIIVIFDYLFATLGPVKKNLAMVFVLVAGVGDGLAEPVGVTLGRHKYATRSCCSSRKYFRSFQGSACVWITTYFWIMLYWYCFTSTTQFWLCMLILPPVMTLAEATSPHTMDTPLLMILGGLILFAISKWV
jgi:dolichol kinase